MTDLEINKVCHSIVTGGEGCWHEVLPTFSRLYCGKCKTAIVDGSNTSCPPNPDPLNNKSDAYDLIQYVVNEWEDKEREDFIQSIQQDEPEYNEYSFPRHLLKNRRALPESLAIYLKEGE